MRRLELLAGCALVLLSSACAHAPVSTEHAPSPSARDSAAGLHAGARIRYVLGGDWRGIRTGRVARASADSLWLESGRTLAVARLRRLDVSRGGGPSEGERSGWGAVVGAAAGGLAGALPAPGGAGRQGPSSRTSRAALGAGIGALFGGIAGLLFWPGERWEPVARPVAATR